MMAIFQQVAEGVWSASWRATLLVGIVLAAQFILGRWLTAKWRHALWFVVVVRLALPVGPGSSWSVFNLLETKPRAAAVEAQTQNNYLPAGALTPALSHREREFALARLPRDFPL